MEIISYKAINKGMLQGSIALKIPTQWGELIIYDISVFMKDGNRWISFPSKTYEKEGEKKYFQYNRFENRENSDAFQKDVLKHLDAFIEKQVITVKTTDEIVVYHDDNEPLPF